MGRVDKLTFTASDGASIVADLFRATPEPAPIVVFFTPYLRGASDVGSLPVKALNEAGIGCVAVDIRGSGESQLHSLDRYPHARCRTARSLLNGWRLSRFAPARSERPAAPIRALYNG